MTHWGAAAASITVKISVWKCPENSTQLLKEEQRPKSPEHLSLGPDPPRRCRRRISSCQGRNSGRHVPFAWLVACLSTSLPRRLCRRLSAPPADMDRSCELRTVLALSGLLWQSLDFLLVRNRACLGNLLSRHSSVRLQCQFCMSANSPPISVHFVWLWLDNQCLVRGLNNDDKNERNQLEIFVNVQLKKI